jgi:hypothetical protein
VSPPTPPTRRLAALAAAAWIAAAPLSPVNAADAQLAPPRVVQDGSRIFVSLTLVGAFDGALADRLDSGLETTFDYELRLLRDRKRWLDDDLQQHRLAVAATYDAITREYLVNVRLDDQLIESRVVRSLHELERAMCELERLPLFEVAGLPRGERLLVRARAVLGARDGWLFFTGRDSTLWQDSAKFRLPRAPG